MGRRSVREAEEGTAEPRHRDQGRSPLGGQGNVARENRKQVAIYGPPATVNQKWWPLRNSIDEGEDSNEIRQLADDAWKTAGAEWPDADRQQFATRLNMLFKNFGLPEWVPPSKPAPPPKGKPKGKTLHWGAGPEYLETLSDADFKTMWELYSPSWQTHPAEFDALVNEWNRRGGKGEAKMTPAEMRPMPTGEEPLPEMTPGELAELDDDSLLDYMGAHPYDTNAEAEDARRNNWAVDPDSGVQIAPRTGEVYGPPDENGFLDILGQLEDHGMPNLRTGKHVPDPVFVPEGWGKPIRLPYNVDKTDLAAIAKWIGTLPGAPK